MAALENNACMMQDIQNATDENIMHFKMLQVTPGCSILYLQIHCKRTSNAEDQ